jgi:hypothetical protein
VKRIPPSAIALNKNRTHYIRAFVLGGIFSFVVTLLERHRKLLTRQIDNLWALFIAALQRRPFTVEDSGILPDPVQFPKLG